MTAQVDVQCLNQIADIVINQVQVCTRAAEIADAPDARAAISTARRESASLLAEIDRQIAGLGYPSRRRSGIEGEGHNLLAEYSGENPNRAALGEVVLGESRLRDEIKLRADDKAIGPSTRAWLNGVLPRVTMIHGLISTMKRQLD